MAAVAGSPIRRSIWRKNVRQIALSAALVLLVFLVACSSSERTLEERGNSLDRKIMCPICPGETIDQAQVQIAKDMRVIVRQKLADGETESEIKDFFVDRYGVGILASPPASGFNLLVWVVPPVTLAIALASLFFILREMRNRKSAHLATEIGTTEMELSPYLDAVEEELSRLGPERPDGGDAAGHSSGSNQSGVNE